jgi:hypothetical protein
VTKQIDFPDFEPRWVFDRDCVVFLALVDKKPVKCLISVEALIQQYGIKYSEKDAVLAFRKHRDEIRELARRKIEAADYDDERGEVLLTTAALSDVDGVEYSEDIRNNPALHKQVLNASAVVRKLLGRAFDGLRISWQVIQGTGPRVVQLSAEDPEIGEQFWDWFSVEQLGDTGIVGSRLHSFVGAYLRARTHKLLERIESGSKES